MTDAQKVIMLDLDNTLFDNQETRFSAAEFVLCTLFKWDRIQALEMYTDIIALSPAFEALGFPNFRHYWNSPELYSSLLLLNDSILHSGFLDSEKSKKKIIDALVKLKDIVNNLIKNYSFKPKRCLDIISMSPNTRNLLKNFAHEVHKHSSSKFVLAAKNLFEKELHFEPLPKVRQFLDRLEKEKVNIYLVTEGITKIQLKKLQKLGLSERFRNRVLTTQAATETLEMKEISNVLESYKIDNEIATLEANEGLQLLTLNYFKQLLNRTSEKSNCQFYATILHSIYSNPNTPQRSLKKLTILSKMEWEKYCPVKVAMIGDRYDKDILPVLKLLGKDGALTVWMRIGKYSKTYSNLNRWQRPTRIINNFSEVGDFLCKPSNWNHIRELKWLKVFNEPVTLHTRLFIEQGKNSKLSSVRYVAQIIEEEINQK